MKYNVQNPQIYTERYITEAYGLTAIINFQELIHGISKGILLVSQSSYKSNCLFVGQFNYKNRSCAQLRNMLKIHHQASFARHLINLLMFGVRPKINY